MHTPTPVFSFSARAALLAAFASLPLVGLAQTSWVGVSGGEWSDPLNWSGTVPDAAGAVVFIDFPGTVNLTGGPFTFGTLSTGVIGGSVVLGDNAVTTDFLRAETTSGQPVIEVDQGSASIFFYGGLEGTQGFDKTGGGKFTFRFNNTEQTYSGPVRVSAGVLGINQASSLGGTTSVTLGQGARLLAEPGSNSGVITLGPEVAFTLAGTQSQLGANNAAVEMIVQGPVGESAAGNGLVKTDAGIVTLTGALSYTGETRIAGGTLRLGGEALLPAGQNLRFNGGAVSVLDVGATSQTVRTLVLDNNTQNRVLTGAAGALTVNGDANLQFTLPNNVAVNASGLGAFTFDRAARNLNVQTANASGVTTIADFFLAGSGEAGGVNNITANQVLIGGAPLSDGNNGNTARLRLGTVNNLNVTSFILGGFNAGGVVNFQAALTAPALRLRGLDGEGPATLLKIGETSSGTRRGEGVLDLTGGSLDAVVTTTSIGRHIAGANNPDTSSFTLDDGDLVTTTLTLAEKLNAGTPTLASTVNQNGGFVTADSVTFGIGGAGEARLLPTYNLSGGALLAGQIQVGGGVFAGTSERRLNLLGGTLTHLAGQDLTVTGGGDTDAARLWISVGETSAIDADVERSVTLGAHTALTGIATLAKTGEGRLVLASDTTGFEGTLQLDAGALALGLDDAITTLAAGSFVWNSGTVAIDLGSEEDSSDRLAVVGALSRGTGSGRQVDLKGVGGAGAYTLATYAETDLQASDLAAVNVPSGLAASFTVGSTALTLTLTLDGGPVPTALESWRVQKFGNAANEGPAADSFDADGDGRPNLLEYALGTEPRVADAGSAPVLGQAAGKLTLTFDRIADPSLVYTVRGSDDVAADWSLAETVFVSTGGDNVAGPVTVEDSVSYGDRARRFLRLEVSY